MQTTLRTASRNPQADAMERARVAAFTAGYDAGRHGRLIVLSDDPDWLHGFFTGRMDKANA